MARTKETVSERITQKVVNTANSDAFESPPLYESIDPDALDMLIEKMSDGEISFTHAGHAIRVKSDGTINLEKQSIGSTTVEKAVSND